MSYQSFPWQAGDSRSFEKLVALYLPALKGKSLLDVGCNAGFFCGWAAFQGAVKVKGIDSNPAFIDQARLWFEDCSFVCMNWEELGPEKYDIILCLSAIHYANDQEQLLNMLMKRLNPGGLLVLEQGIAPGEADEFVPVKRSIDTRLFPTQTRLHRMFSPYTFKYIGPSVEQAGDPLPRHVYHVYNALPLAVLFMDKHYSGKTRTAEAMIKPGIPRLSGDAVYHRIAGSALKVPAELAALVRPKPGTKHIDSGTITHTVCENGLLPQLAAVYIQLAGNKDFVLDSYVPDTYQPELASILAEAGFFVVVVSLRGVREQAWTRQRQPLAQYEAYMDSLVERSSIDEEAYLAANPDVARAVAEGKLSSAQRHYWFFGKREKRRLKP